MSHLASSYYQLYEEQLGGIGFGTPLWNPILDNRVKIGDVGFMRRGHFCPLLRTTCTAQELGDDPPSGFTPLQLSPSGVQLSTRKSYPIHSMTVSSCGASVGASSGVSPVAVVPGASINFQFSQGKGALFLTRRDSRCVDSLQDGTFRDYIRKHYMSWVDLARARGYGDVDPVLISGFDSSHDYAMMTYAASDNQLSALVTADIPVASHFWASSWARWASSGTVHSNWGPTEESSNQRLEQEPPSGSTDQPQNGYVTFFRGWHMRYRAFFFPFVMKAAAEPKDLNPKDLDPEAGRQGILVDDQAGAEVVSNMPSESVNPLDVVFKHLFENSTADYALIHDDDLRRISEITFRYKKSIEDVFEVCPATVVTMDDDGVVSLTLERLISWSKDTPELPIISSQGKKIGRDRGDEDFLDIEQKGSSFFYNELESSSSRPEYYSYMYFNNWLQANKRIKELNVMIDRQGPDHNPVWIVEIFLANMSYGKGEANTKARAKDVAASVALTRLLRSG